MKRLTSSIVLPVAIAGFVLVLAGEAMWLRYEQRVAVRGQAALRHKIRERDRLMAQSPALNPENEQAIADDLERIERALVEVRSEWQHDDAAALADGVPTRSTEAYFDLARFVERERAAAGAARVGLRSDERFGFAAYANEGPAADVLPQVYRQRLVSEFLMERLIAAHPRALLALRREAVGPLPAARSQGDDCFVMDRAFSVQRAGNLETMAFRVEFSGQTASLRDFLVALADPSRSLLVRSVEVEPLPVAVSAAVSNAPEAVVPLVRRNFSKFSVLVEAVRLGSPATKDLR